MRLVLVGERNPYGPDPEFALYCAPHGSSGERLQRVVLGVAPETYLALPRYNLCDGAWAMAAARARAALILEQHPDDLVAALGAKVALAFGFPFEPLAYHEVLDRGRVVVLPHPSGLNRFWNTPDAVRRVRDQLVAVGCTLPLGEVAP